LAQPAPLSQGQLRQAQLWLAQLWLAQLWLARLWLARLWQAQLWRALSLLPEWSSPVSLTRFQLWAIQLRA
jgi:hypothetical protein